MASEAANIGANFSNYSGNPNLGGSSLGAVKIDTGPLEDFAKYVMLYNREEYMQRQKNADEKILELAKLATIHVNDLRGKDRDEIMKQLNETITYAQDYARQVAHSPKEKIEQNLEWQKKTIDLFNNYQSGKARSVKYTAELDKIESDAKISEATKAEKRKELEAMFGKTKISEQFSGVPDYNLISVSLPAPLTTETNIIQEGANANVDAKLTSFNYKANSQLAFNILSGLGKLYPSEKTPEGQTAEAKQQRTIEGEAKAWRDSTNTLNSILQMKDVNGKFTYYTTDANGKVVFDAVAFEDDISQSPTLLGAYTALRNMDADARAKYNQFIQGRFSDKGFDFKLPPNATLNDFKAGFVDFTKPLSAEQVVTAGMFSRFGGDKMDKKVTPTDNLFQRGQLALGWFNAKTGRIQEDRLAKAAGVSLDMATSAKSYAEALMNKLNSLKDAGGLISKDKLSKLTSDELKYMGKGTTTENKFTLTPLQLKGVLTPLQIQEGITSSNDITSMIIDTDGNIKLYSGGTGKSLGTQKGESINVATIGINKLGDEMVTTTGKEGYNFNNLIPLYESVNTQPTTQSQKTELQVINGFEIPKGATVVYSKQTGKALGYTLNGKNYKF